VAATAACGDGVDIQLQQLAPLMPGNQMVLQYHCGLTTVAERQTAV
jgi:hypothetical protein